MTRAVSRKALLRAMVQGIAAAQEHYEYWSDGEWLGNAPEYLCTVEVARSLVSVGCPFVTLEDRVRKIMREAGAVGRGRPTRRTRITGSSDLIVWWASGRPRAVVEVKGFAYRYPDIREDVLRIRDILRKNRKESSLQFGAVVFYTSAAAGPRKSGYEKVSVAIARTVRELRAHIDNDLRLETEEYGVTEVDQDAWAATCVALVSRSSPSREQRAIADGFRFEIRKSSTYRR